MARAVPVTDAEYRRRYELVHDAKVPGKEHLSAGRGSRWKTMRVRGGTAMPRSTAA